MEKELTAVNRRQTELVIDEDVKAVAEFMQRNISASRLVSVSEGVRALAPILWGRYGTESIAVLSLDEAEILDD